MPGGFGGNQRGFTEPSYGDTVTVTITDGSTDEVLSTQEIKMDNMS